MLEFCTNLGPTFKRAYVVKYWFRNRYRFEISAKNRWFWYWYRYWYWNGSKCNFVFGIGFEIQLSHYWFRYWFRNKCLPARNIGIESKWTVSHSPDSNPVKCNTNKKVPVINILRFGVNIVHMTRGRHLLGYGRGCSPSLMLGSQVLKPVDLTQLLMCGAVWFCSKDICMRGCSQDP